MPHYNYRNSSPSSRNGLPIFCMAVLCWLVFFTWSVTAQEEEPSPPQSYEFVIAGDAPEETLLEDLHVERVFILTDSNIHKAVQSWLEDPDQAASEWGNISDWNTQYITDMSRLFAQTTISNEDLSGWNTAAVTDMSQMFYAAPFFEGNGLQSWNVEKVTKMNSMFAGATVFQADLSAWNPLACTNFVGMFAFTSSFNSDVSNWNVASAQSMDRMFYYSSAFAQQDICWDSVSQDVVSGTDMFCGSSGSFSSTCSNIPKGAEFCGEEREEDEEDEQVLQEGSSSGGSNRDVGNDGKPSVTESGYGGSGGVGAQGSGVSGRDHPELTANAEDGLWGDENSDGQEEEEDSNTEAEEMTVESDTTTDESEEGEGLDFNNSEQVSSSGATHIRQWGNVMMMSSSALVIFAISSYGLQ